MCSDNINTINDILPEWLDLEKITISEKFDKITFEFYIYTDSFVLPRKMQGYKYLKHFIITPEKPFHPLWEVDKYQNLVTGNLVYFQISSKMFDRNFFPRYLVKITFHDERTRLTEMEINIFLEKVIDSYRTYLNGQREKNLYFDDLRALTIPQPSLSEIEITLDFKGNSYAIMYLHDNIRDNLYLLRCKKRISFNDKNGGPYYSYDGRVLLKAEYTNYISRKYRDYSYIDKKENDCFRLELVLTKQFLQRKKISTPKEFAEKFDIAQYWATNHFFFRFNEDKILSIVEKNNPDMVMPTTYLLRCDGLFTPAQIFQRLKEYKKTNGKPMFYYPSRQLLLTKWGKLDEMIQTAFMRLSLSGKPVITEPIIKVRKRDSRTGKTGRKSKEPIILKSINLLKKQGKKITYKELARTAKVTEKTIAKYKHLLGGRG